MAGLPVELDGGETLKVNGTTIVPAHDVLVSNGVIHVIDKVLSPAKARARRQLAGAAGFVFGLRQQEQQR